MKLTTFLLHASAIGYALAAAIASDGQLEARDGGKGGRTIKVKHPASIQKAIDSASCGDTITVESGSYAENLLITKDRLTLISKGATLTPPGSPKPNACTDVFGPGTSAGICIAGSGLTLAPFIGQEHRKVLAVAKPVKDVSVSGFTVSSFNGANILVLGAADTKISKNTLTSGYIYGLLAAGSKNTLLSGNTISVGADIGFIALCADDFRDVKVVENSISTYIVGLCVQTNRAEVRGNSVTNSCFGAFIDPFVDGARVVNNRLTAGNPICQGITNGTYGVFVDGATNSRVEGNFISGMDPLGVFVTDDPCTSGGLACSTRPGQAAIASGNVVKNNKFEGNRFDAFSNSAGAGNVIVV